VRRGNKLARVPPDLWGSHKKLRDRCESCFQAVWGTSCSSLLPSLLGGGVCMCLHGRLILPPPLYYGWLTCLSVAGGVGIDIQRKHKAATTFHGQAGYHIPMRTHRHSVSHGWMKAVPASLCPSVPSRRQVRWCRRDVPELLGETV